MSTYVVRFLGATPDEFRGRVRHVSTGEEENFASPEDLYDFMERMNATHARRSADGDESRREDERTLRENDR